MQQDEPVNEGLILAYMEGMSDHTRLARGLWGMYEWLDRAPKGRNETASGWPQLRQRRITA